MDEKNLINITEENFESIKHIDEMEQNTGLQENYKRFQDTKNGENLKV